MEAEFRYINEFKETDREEKEENKIFKSLFMFILLSVSYKTPINNKNNNNINITKDNIDYIDNENIILDTINPEELNEARNSFKQYTYRDTIDPPKILKYNFFIPEFYLKKKIL